MNAFSASSNPFGLQIDSTSNIQAESIKKLLSFYKSNPEKTDLDISTIDLEEVEQWIIESIRFSESLAGSITRPNCINSVTWYKKRAHIFPHPSLIKDELQRSLTSIKHSSIPSVIKAATLWYEIVSIHPFNEANKGTGRALASIILLQNGYLPPLIQGEDGNRYVQILINSFISDKTNKAQKFIEFIIEMILKTQHSLIQKTV